MKIWVQCSIYFLSAAISSCADGGQAAVQISGDRFQQSLGVVARSVDRSALTQQALITRHQRLLRRDCRHVLFRSDRSRLPEAGPNDGRHRVAAGVRRALRPRPGQEAAQDPQRRWMMRSALAPARQSWQCGPRSSSGTTRRPRAASDGIWGVNRGTEHGCHSLSAQCSQDCTGQAFIATFSTSSSVSRLPPCQPCSARPCRSTA